MLRVHGLRVRQWGLLAALTALALLGGCRHGDEVDDPAFPELVDANCRSREGCDQLLARLTAKRDFCYREYGTAEDRPADCVWNDIYWWALKDHIELLELRTRAAAPCPRGATPAGGDARELSRARQELEAARAQWRSEQQTTIEVERAWSEIEPKKCAIEGDETTCYQLVRFIALGDNPHRAEAQAALDAGQRIIDARRKRSGGQRSAP